ncbi:MAG: sugar phosphate isomerase/epimerase [Oscillospiraceae bacterium]|nr:sugar phosphate isomerase/epimerase [Oscillospiraceae bacterium]
MENINNLNDIRIGVIVGADNALKVIPQLIPYGFESFEITFGSSCEGYDLREYGKHVQEIIGENDCVISCLGLYSDPLSETAEGEAVIKCWENLIDNVDAFGSNIIAGFTGRLADMPVDKSIGRYKTVFGELAKRAEDKGVKIAFENCDCGGNWNRGGVNIAFCERAWEMMFDVLPNENIGLQWEPCHHMVQLVDPIPQLKRWVNKIICLHGKDATIDWNIVNSRGISCGETFAWHRTPGFGDSNWTNIISILRMNGFKGSIDIEGFHDPVYKGELEYTGQVYALNYLKKCKGGEFVKIEL